MYIYIYVNKKSPYSNSYYLSSIVSNYCLTTVVLNLQVQYMSIKCHHTVTVIILVLLSV